MSKRKRGQASILDLHHLDLKPHETPEESIYRQLDRFLTPFLLRKNVNIKIIVGKGIGSKRLINGKNPTRHYVENYLNQLGISWQNGSDYFEGNGVINISW